jgi:hypothetical protein
MPEKHTMLANTLKIEQRISWRFGKDIPIIRIAQSLRALPGCRAESPAL